MGEGVVFDVGVEVGAIGKANGVGRGPAACGGVIVAAAKVDPAAFRVEAFAGIVPGIGGAGAMALGLAKGGIGIGFGQVVCGVYEHGDVAAMVMDGVIDLVQF